MRPRPSPASLCKDRRGGVAVIAAMTGALACLVAADRYEHLERTVRPHVAAGGIVVSDRYLASSLVLQGADGIPSSYVRLLNSEIDVPDLTVQLRDTPEALYQRSNERGQYSRFHPVDPTASGAEQASYDRAFAELAAEGWSVALVEVGSRSVETLTTELLSLFTPLLR